VIGIEDAGGSQTMLFEFVGADAGACGPLCGKAAAGADRLTTVASLSDSLTAAFQRIAAPDRTWNREANVLRESPGNSTAIFGSPCERLRGYSVVSELRRIDPIYLLE
jgi:hypothetical protein